MASKPQILAPEPPILGLNWGLRGPILKALGLRSGTLGQRWGSGAMIVGSVAKIEASGSRLQTLGP